MVEGESEIPVFRGVLGIWPYPLINFIIFLTFTLRSQQFTRPRMRTYQFIRDEKGRIIEILEIEK